MLLAADFKFVDLQHDFFKFSEKMCDAGRVSGHVAACPAPRRLARTSGQ